MTIALITGTRPEIIKMFPIMNHFDSISIDYKYIHTGQHYDYSLFLKFIEEFGICKPDFLVSINKSNPVDQVSIIMKQVGIILDKLNPSLVLIEGDTNSVLASALASLKSRIPIAHVESGLRSNDWKTVEEHNRRVVDHISDILFSPTEISTRNLRDEHVYGEIHTVGNTVIDAINLCFGKDFCDDASDKGNTCHSNSDIFSSTGIDASVLDDFVLITMHRSENVDDLSNLKKVLTAISDSKLNYIFPMHPHTHKSIEEYGLTRYIGKEIRLIDPLGYLDFLKLLTKCQFVITDSGGIQEEITSPHINKRAIVLRDCTERPESVESGHSVLCKIEHNDILEHIERFRTSDSKMKISVSPYGSGDAAVKIAEILTDNFSLLT
jgi:UDP-N-acetylglucosamine 2-epimerase (non-hydrolysing)